MRSRSSLGAASGVWRNANCPCTKISNKGGTLLRIMNLIFRRVPSVSDVVG